ncbi:MAG: cytochrome c1 [Pseudomonadota bacterium]
MFSVNTQLRLAAVALGVVLGLSATSMALAAGEQKTPAGVSWSFNGPFGTFDRAQLQRGFKVYREVCSACHGLEKLAFRNLMQPGGPEFSEEETKVIAAEYLVMDGPDDFGDMFERDGGLPDKFPPAFPNDNAARAANGGAYPPDFSVIAKARKYGPDYLNALLIGYTEPPADVDAGDKYYNPYFAGGLISMAPPLDDGLVEYTDGTPELLENYAEDVSAFLMWTAEPKLEERKRVGFQVILFMLVLTVLLYFTKRKIWANVDH